MKSWKLVNVKLNTQKRIEDPVKPSRCVFHTKIDNVFRPLTIIGKKALS